MRRVSLWFLLALLPVPVAAQSSQFGIRGLGIPVRPLSPRATATGGAFGGFDIESSVNPASIAGTIQFTSLFTSAQNFRSSTNPFGSSSGRDNRFPQILVAGPVGGTPLAVAVSLSGYTDRNFSLGTADSIDLRGARVGVFDTLSSRGGLSDLRFATAWRASSWLQLGIGLHAITGSNRIENRRVFSDSSYAFALERSELSYLGLGVSAGALIRPIPRLTLAGSYRSDGNVKVDRDTTRIATTDLPTSYSLGVRWQPSMRAAVAASYQQANWSSADADMKQQGGIGALNAYQVSAGFELLRDPKDPGHRPIRFGGSYATLPFPLRAGKQAHEYGISVGTGIRFTGGRGGFDFALQQLWRSDGDGYTERATILTFGFSLRP
ncbi:MAG: hypothetical protein SFV24_07075 [Gemmatimonadales bacterium]|nr:hypothetical protein [Gemmatimonadales bacterium]